MARRRRQAALTRIWSTRPCSTAHGFGAGSQFDRARTRSERSCEASAEGGAGVTCGARTISRQPRATRSSPRGRHRPRTPGETVFADRPLRFRSLTRRRSGPFRPGGPGWLPRRLQDPGREARRAAAARPASWWSGAIPDAATRFRACRRIRSSRRSSPTTKAQLVGTVSVRLDSEKGLSADELYRNEIDALRSAGRPHLRIHPARRRQDRREQAGAGRPVPHRVPLRVGDPRMHACGDRGQSAARRLLRPGAALRPDRRRADEPAGRCPRGPALRAVCDHRRRVAHDSPASPMPPAPGARSFSTGFRRTRKPEF